MRNESGIAFSKIVTQRHTIRIRFDYPFQQTHYLTFRSKRGFTLGEFVRRVNQGYRRLKHDMFGHCLADLGFEGYKHCGKGLYVLYIGS